MTSNAPELEVKGNTFMSVLTAAENLHGAAFRDAVIARLPAESGDALRFGSVISAGWYPVRWYRELHAAIIDEANDPNVPREIGRASIRVEMTGVHRLILRVISIETMQSQAARFFGSYFRPGNVSVERVNPSTSRTSFGPCRGFDRAVWLEQLGCMEELLVQAGQTAGRVRIVSGGGDGDDEAVFESTWR